MAQILLLEADRLLAANTRRFFEQAGHRLQSFADPQAAITAVDTQRPDLIILELQLANRSGLEFLYELRSYPEWQTIPAIVLTGLDQPAIARYGKPLARLNVSAIFHKPQITQPQLLAEAETWLQPTSVK